MVQANFWQHQICGSKVGQAQPIDLQCQVAPRGYLLRRIFCHLMKWLMYKTVQSLYCLPSSLTCAKACSHVYKRYIKLLHVNKKYLSKGPLQHSTRRQGPPVLAGCYCSESFWTLATGRNLGFRMVNRRLSFEAFPKQTKQSFYAQAKALNKNSTRLYMYIKITLCTNHSNMYIHDSSLMLLSD